MSDSLGATIDADVAALKLKIAALEAKALAEEHKITAWLAARWPHFITWGGMVALYIAKKVVL